VFERVTLGTVLVPIILGTVLLLKLSKLFLLAADPLLSLPGLSFSDRSHLGFLLDSGLLSKFLLREHLDVAGLHFASGFLLLLHDANHGG